MSDTDSPNKRAAINLRSLSASAQWLIAISIVATISAVAWWIGRDQPVPGWITRYLVPSLGWIYLALVVIALLSFWRRRLKRSSAVDGRGR